MSESFVPSSLHEAVELCNDALHLRRIKHFLDRSSLSADIKALPFDLAHLTIKGGAVVAAIGQRMVGIAIRLAQTVPNTPLGVLVALVLSTVIASLASPALAVALQKLPLLIGIIAGAIEDIRQHAMKDAMERVARQFTRFRTVAA